MRGNEHSRVFRILNAYTLMADMDISLFTPPNSIKQLRAMVLVMARKVVTEQNAGLMAKNQRICLEKLLRMLSGTRSEKLRRQVEEAEALLKQQEQQSDCYNGRKDEPLVPRQLRQ